MRILFIHEACGYAGGLEQSLADLATALRARGHHCVLAYSRRVPSSGRRSFAENFDASIPCAEMGAAEGAVPIRRIRTDVCPDVAYIHKLSSLAPLSQGLHGIPSVRMIHDHDVYCPSGLKYFRHSGRICEHRIGWRCWLDGGVVRRAGNRLQFTSIPQRSEEMGRNQTLDRLLVPSHFMREQLLANGFSPGRVEVLPHLSKPFGDPSPIPEDPRILYVGQLIRGKGLDLLVRSLAQVRCAFELDVVGTGNAAAQIERLVAQRDLQERIRFHGQVPHDQVEAYLRSARVVVFPSRWPEPLGLSGIEALGLGRPVVGFNVGGVSDWLKDEETGLVVAPQDTRGMARAVERLLQDHELASDLGRRGAEFVRDRYHFDTYIDRVEKMLAQVCSHHSGGEPPV